MTATAVPLVSRIVPFVPVVNAAGHRARLTARLIALTLDACAVADELSEMDRRPNGAWAEWRCPACGTRGEGNTSCSICLHVRRARERPDLAIVRP